MNPTSTLGAVALLVMVAAPAFAQPLPVEPTATSNRPIRLEAPAGSPAPARSKAPSAFDGMRAGNLIGETVYNTGGESLGEIEDIVIRREDNEIAALVGMGGFLGLEAKQVALLLGDLEMQGGRIVVTNLTRTDFQQRRVYQANGWVRHDPNRAISNATAR